MYFLLFDSLGLTFFSYVMRPRCLFLRSLVVHRQTKTEEPHHKLSIGGLHHRQDDSRYCSSAVLHDPFVTGTTAVFRSARVLKRSIWLVTHVTVHVAFNNI
jgi:hypothetical protein